MIDVAGISGIGGIAPASKTAKAGGVDFGAVLKDKMQGAIDTQKTAEKTASQAILGKSSMADLINSVNEADATLNTMTAIRDRLVKAYEELMRMPI